MTDIAQGSACHRFHTARQRLARWLLSASDRTQSVRIELTQERLAQALGLQRTGVTVASVALQDAGAIKSRHGRITIIDRRRTESLACECYRMRRDRLIPGTIRADDVWEAVSRVAANWRAGSGSDRRAVVHVGRRGVPGASVVAQSLGRIETETVPI